MSPGDTWSSVGLGVSQEGRCSKLVLQEKDEARLDELGWRGTGWCTRDGISHQDSCSWSFGDQVSKEGKTLV